MFKATGIQEASDENGITIEIDGYVLRYIKNRQVMEFGAQPCPPTAKAYAALFNIYFPRQLKWLAPHHEVPISAVESKQIETHIIDALRALDCQADFTLPATG
jgi:hypothetical protein